MFSSRKRDTHFFWLKEGFLITSFLKLFIHYALIYENLGMSIESDTNAPHVHSHLLVRISFNQYGTHKFILCLPIARKTSFLEEVVDMPRRPRLQMRFRWDWWGQQWSSSVIRWRRMATVCLASTPCLMTYWYSLSSINITSTQQSRNTAAFHYLSSPLILYILLIITYQLFCHRELLPCTFNW